MALDLFDVLRDLFTSNLSKYNDSELKNIGFSVQRIMSIQYPKQAQSQNLLGINMTNVVRYWHAHMKGRYNQIPGWAKMSTAKERKAFNEGRIQLPDKEVVESYKLYNDLSSHDFNYLCRTEADTLSDELTAHEKLMNAK